MALKRKLTKEAFDKLSEEMKGEYKEAGDSFMLDIDGDEDTGALKRAKDRESQRARDAEKRAKDAEDRLADMDNVDAKKRGDIEGLEKSWNKKHEDMETSYKDKLSKKDVFIKNSLIDTVAREMAAKISTSPALILHHIKSRLTADLDGDTPSTKILDAAGQPSALSLAEFEKEIVSNADFASIIIASKASGSGASNDGKQNTSGSAPGVDNKQASLSEMKPTDLAATLKAAKER